MISLESSQFDYGREETDLRFSFASSFGVLFSSDDEDDDDEAFIEIALDSSPAFNPTQQLQLQDKLGSESSTRADIVGHTFDDNIDDEDEMGLRLSFSFPIGIPLSSPNTSYPITNSTHQHDYSAGTALNLHVQKRPKFSSGILLKKQPASASITMSGLVDMLLSGLKGSSQPSPMNGDDQYSPAPLSNVHKYSNRKWGSSETRCRRASKITTISNASDGALSFLVKLRSISFRSLLASFTYPNYNCKEKARPWRTAQKSSLFAAFSSDGKKTTDPLDKLQTTLQSKHRGSHRLSKSRPNINLIKNSTASTSFQVHQDCEKPQSSVTFGSLLNQLQETIMGVFLDVASKTRSSGKRKQTKVSWPAAGSTDSSPIHQGATVISSGNGSYARENSVQGAIAYCKGSVGPTD